MLTNSGLNPIPERPRSPKAHSSHLILSHAHSTCGSFLTAFDSVRRARSAHGTPTDEEQDLLRAMLLFASAGLDSMVKQLVRDALPHLIDIERGTRKEFEQFVVRELGVRSLGSRLETLDVKTLASVIVEESPRISLVRRLVASLTSDSLQSADQLLRVAAHFGITAAQLFRDISKLRDVFDVRNKISHEMDIDFSQRNRNRFPRRKNDMIRYTTVLLTVADNFLSAVDKKLTTQTTEAQ